MAPGDDEQEVFGIEAGVGEVGGFFEEGASGNRTSCAFLALLLDVTQT
jgi:hypothetical protein